MAVKLQRKQQAFIFFLALQPEGLFVKAGTLIFPRNDTDD